MSFPPEANEVSSVPLGFCARELVCYVGIVKAFSIDMHLDGIEAVAEVQGIIEGWRIAGIDKSAAEKVRDSSCCIQTHSMHDSPVVLAET